MADGGLGRERRPCRRPAQQAGEREHCPVDGIAVGEGCARLLGHVLQIGCANGPKTTG
jgi:hypothetical protein